MHLQTEMSELCTSACSLLQVGVARLDKQAFGAAGLNQAGRGLMLFNLTKPPPEGARGALDLDYPPDMPPNYAGMGATLVSQEVRELACMHTLQVPVEGCGPERFVADIPLLTAFGLCQFG